MAECFTDVHALLFCSSCECMRDETIKQRLHKAILLKALQVKLHHVKKLNVYTCCSYLTQICWLYFQDSLSHLLINPTWHSKDVFTAVVQLTPLILEQISDTVSKKYHYPDDSYAQQFCDCQLNSRPSRNNT